MRRVSFILVATVAVIAAATWGLCAPVYQTRCIVNTSGVALGWRSLAGWNEYVDIGPGQSIRMWGMIEWHKIESIRIVHGLFGAYLRVRYGASSDQRTIDIGPLDKHCELEVRARLAGAFKFLP